MLLIAIAAVLLLLVLNGLFAMSELAVVSARKGKLQVRADRGDKGAAAALRLAEQPTRFLSSVQVGITLIGILAGAFGQATIAGELDLLLEGAGPLAPYSEAISTGVVVVCLTYLSLIVGELVPKQIALRDPEKIAARVAPTMVMLSRVGAPLVWLLDKSGKVVLAILGHSGESNASVTDDEIRTVLAEAHSAGVIETEESAMITSVMRLADRNARGLMTPRRDVEVVDIEDSAEEIREQLRQTQRSRLPVRNGASDEILGVLFAKDAFDALASGKELNIRELLREVPVVSDLTSAVDVIQSLRRSTVHMVLVYDEYGHFEGIISSGDVLEAITGAFQEDDDEEPAMVEREDGSFLVAGWMPADEFADRMGFQIDEDAEFETVAGLVLDEFRRLPELGEHVTRNGWRFEVIDLDGHRIDKVLVSRAA